MSIFLLLPRYTCVAALIFGLSAEVAVSQSLRGTTGPSELPPTSFQGKQFVDSQGCAFIRAGYGNRVTWVPRVSRSRKLLCGFRPTFGSKVEPTVRTQTAARRVVKPTAPATVKPQVRAVQQVKSQTVQRTGSLPKVNPNSRIAPKVPPVDAKIAPCFGASSLSSKYINQDAGVRCGSQDGGTRTVIREEVLRQGSLQNELRGPKGVNRRIADARAIKPPKGFRRVHDDGRLNPLRGVGTSSGKSQMLAVWSETIPRYLVDPATGKRIR